jgi:hypothetical protein
MISSEVLVLVVLLWRVGHPRLKTAWGLDSMKLSSPCHECRNTARPRLQSCCLLPHSQRRMLKKLKQLSQRWCCAVCQPIFSGRPGFLFGPGVILAKARRAMAVLLTTTVMGSSGQMSAHSADTGQQSGEKGDQALRASRAMGRGRNGVCEATMNFSLLEVQMRVSLRRGWEIALASEKGGTVLAGLKAAY